MEKIKQNPIVKKLGFNRIILCGVLIFMYVMFSILGNNFVGLPRIMSALNYAYFLGFLSLGVTFVIATGGIDFSIGPVMFCAALDSMKYENIVGTIAGDDTIFVLMRTESDADNLVKTFKKLIWG